MQRPKIYLLLFGGAGLAYFVVISGLNANFLLKEGLILLPLQALALIYVLWFNLKRQNW